MIDGSSVLMQMMWGFRAMGMWTDERGTNMLDTGAPYYDTYETCPTAATSRSAPSSRSSTPCCCRGSGWTPPTCPASNDVARWPELRAAFTEAFAAHDRDHWAKVFDGTDACVTPVLSFAEVETEPHITERDTFFRDVSDDGDNLEPMPAPRFSRSAAADADAPRRAGRGHRGRSSRLGIVPTNQLVEWAWFNGLEEH